MLDLPQTETGNLDMLSCNRVEKSVTTDLTVVAQHQMRHSFDVKPQFVTALHDVCVSLDSRPFDPIIAKMIGAGIDAADIADAYVPAVARLLGDQWCDDEVGFATVTIGSARLQGLLRAIGPEWQADRAADADAPALLIAVGANVHHTLGAMVLTGQMRRRGYSVRLMVGAEPEHMGPALRRARFDAVLLSSSSGESLTSLRQLVTAVKSSTGFPPPVIIGGSIVEKQRLAGVDIVAMTGADLVTCDPNEALAFCGLTAIPRGGVAGKVGLLV